MSPSNVAFSVVSFLTFLLICIPLPWHFQAWNTGTCLYMIWTALGTLIFFINSIIWKSNAVDVAPVWCDISTKILIGISIAIPAASLCINRRLYYIASVQSVTRTKREKRRAIMVDLAIGVGLPLLVMALHYIVQGHRYDIYEEIGCTPYTYNTPPAYILVYTPPLLIALVSGTYATLSIIAFRRRHADVMKCLSNTPGMNSSRYLRLMALAGIEVLAGVPLSLAVIIMNATLGTVHPWISWEDTHWGFSRVDQVPSILWKSTSTGIAMTEMTRWLLVSCALTFFAFFGFADEAQRQYKTVFSSVAKRVGYTSTGSNTKVGSSTSSSNGFSKFKGSLKGTFGGTSSQPGLPIYVSQEIVEKRDSLDSISDLTSIRDTSDAGSSPPSPFNTLTKSEAPGLKASLFALRTSDKPPPSPSSASASGSFLDLSTSDKIGSPV